MKAPHPSRTKTGAPRLRCTVSACSAAGRTPSRASAPYRLLGTHTRSRPAPYAARCFRPRSVQGAESIGQSARRKYLCRRDAHPPACRPRPYRLSCRRRTGARPRRGISRPRGRGHRRRQAPRRPCRASRCGCRSGTVRSRRSPATRRTIHRPLPGRRRRPTRRRSARRPWSSGCFRCCTQCFRRRASCCCRTLHRP